MIIEIENKEFAINGAVVNEQQIVYKNDNGEEMTRESYTSAHWLWGADLNNLTQEQKSTIQTKYLI